MGGLLTGLSRNEPQPNVDRAAADRLAGSVRGSAAASTRVSAARRKRAQPSKSPRETTPPNRQARAETDRVRAIRWTSGPSTRLYHRPLEFY
jgi:hypothetical protein